MGDFGSAAAGGMNMIGTMYAADRNAEAQNAANRTNLQIHREDNQFNADQAKIARTYNTRERLAVQDFTAGQADLVRQFQSDEADKSRQFQIDSIGKAAGEYQKLGINPAGAVQGVPSGGSIPSGAAGSSSPASASPASASAFAGVQPTRTENPFSSFLSAFMESQRTNSQVQAQKLKDKYQEVENKFQISEKLLQLHQRRAEIGKTLADKDLSEEQRNKLKFEEKKIETETDLLESTKDDIKSMKHEELTQARINTGIKAQEYVQACLQTEWLPRVLAANVNLTENQAQAVLLSAQAAVKQAVAAEINAKTGEKRLVFDEKVYEEVGKQQIEANIELAKQQKETSAAQEDLTVRQKEAIGQEQALKIVGNSTDMVVNALKAAATMIGAKFVFGKAGSASKGTAINPYDNWPTTSTSRYVPSPSF